MARLNEAGEIKREGEGEWRVGAEPVVRRVVLRA